MAVGPGYPVRMRWRWVLFDVGETLIRPRESFGAVYARVLRGLGVDQDAGTLERALRMTWGEVNAGVPPGTDRYRIHPGGEAGYWLRFVERTLDLAGGCPSGTAARALEPLRTAFAQPEAWAVFPDVEPALDRLGQAGMRLGVVSNWDSRLPTLLHRLGLRHRFDALAVSSLEGVEKPDPALVPAGARAPGRRAGSDGPRGRRPGAGWGGRPRRGLLSADRRPQRAARRRMRSPISPPSRIVLARLGGLG